MRGIADWIAKRKGEHTTEADSELGPGNLFATGLVAGGAIAGVVVAIFSAKDSWAAGLAHLSMEESLTSALGPKGYEALGALCYAAMAAVLFKVARTKVDAT
jgi:hypothetical protein